MSVAAVDGTEGMELRLQEKPPQNCSVVSPNNRKLVKTIQIQEKSEKWKNCGTDCLAKTRTVQSATTAPGTLGLKQSWIVQPRAHCRYDFLGRWMKGQKACKFQIFGRQEECEFSILPVHTLREWLRNWARNCSAPDRHSCDLGREDDE